MKNRVLLVDGEQKGTHGVGAALSAASDEWETRLVEDGRAALEHLASNPCDIVITGRRLPDMPVDELRRTRRAKFRSMGVLAHV